MSNTMARRPSNPPRDDDLDDLVDRIQGFLNLEVEKGSQPKCVANARTKITEAVHWLRIGRDYRGSSP